MSQSSKRARRISDLIKREVALLMKTSINDPRLSGIMITSVDLAPDLGNAKIYFTLSDSAKVSEAKLALEKATGFVRHSLANNTDLRYTPGLSFVHDESIARANDLLDLIDRVQPKNPTSTETDSDG